MAERDNIDLLAFSENERIEAHQLENRWRILQPVQTEQALQINQGRSRWERHVQNEQSSNIVNLHEPQLSTDNNVCGQSPESSEESVIGSDWGARLPAGSHRWEIRAESQPRAQPIDRTQRVSSTSYNSSSRKSDNPIMCNAQVETATSYLPTMQITQHRRSAVTIKATRNHSLTESEYAPNIYAQQNGTHLVSSQQQRNAIDMDRTISQVSISTQCTKYDTVYETPKSVHHHGQPAHSQRIQRTRMHKSVPPIHPKNKQEHDRDRYARRPMQENERDRYARRPTREERYLSHNTGAPFKLNQQDDYLSTRLVG